MRKITIYAFLRFFILIKISIRIFVCIFVENLQEFEAINFRREVNGLLTDGWFLFILHLKTFGLVTELALDVTASWALIVIIFAFFGFFWDTCFGFIALDWMWSDGGGCNWLKIRRLNFFYILLQAVYDMAAYCRFSLLVGLKVTFVLVDLIMEIKSLTHRVGIFFTI